jgi:DNA-binding transcriptional regulator YdaS (Cro superfamily)
VELKDYLSKKKISQSNFAKKVGITRAHISQIVNKKTNLSTLLAKHIENITEGDVTMQELIVLSAPSRFKVKRNEKDNSIRG